MNDEIIGNLTTIIKIVIMTIAPSIAVYIGTDEQSVVAFLTACLTFALAVYDAKYPNTMKVFETAEPSEVLNDEYILPDDEDGDEIGE